MKSKCSTTPEFNQSALGIVLDVRGESARRGYFDRISKTIERSILAFVVLMTLLGNYASHSHLLSDALIS